MSTVFRICNQNKLNNFRWNQIVFTFSEFQIEKLKLIKVLVLHSAVSPVLFDIMDPANILLPSDQVFGLSELRDQIFGYLDPSSVKAAALVSR